MIYFLYGDQLKRFPALKRSMHVNRAEQFHKRLGWDVTVDTNGEEYDQYDALNPMYVIAVDSMGIHAGSMRFLPTTGRTMVNEHFLHLTDGVAITSPLIWECTRFCISPTAGPRTAISLLAAGGKLMRMFGLAHFVGVYDGTMERVYSLAGCSPTVVGSTAHGKSPISVGLWEFDAEAYAHLLNRAKISTAEMDRYFDEFVNSDFYAERADSPNFGKPRTPQKRLLTEECLA